MLPNPLDREQGTVLDLERIAARQRRTHLVRCVDARLALPHQRAGEHRASGRRVEVSRPENTGLVRERKRCRGPWVYNGSNRISIIN